MVCLCINPDCPDQERSDIETICVACGSKVLLPGMYRIVRQLVQKPDDYKQNFPHYPTSRVYEATDGKTPKIIKVLYNNSEDYKILFDQEINTLINLNQCLNIRVPKIEHPQAVSFKIKFPENQVSRQRAYYLVMEKIEGENLQNWVQNHGIIRESQAIDWMKQLLETLNVVHNYIIHRDLKPSNIMITPDNQLVIIDYGYLREILEQINVLLPGTFPSVNSGYTPPEQLRRNPKKQSDFYALGRTFVYLLTGKEPSKILELHQGDFLWKKYAPKVSKKFAKLLNWLMEDDYNKRPKDIQEILKRLDKITNPTFLERLQDYFTLRRKRILFYWLIFLLSIGLLLWVGTMFKK